MMNGTTAPTADGLSQLGKQSAVVALHLPGFTRDASHRPVLLCGMI